MDQTEIKERAQTLSNACLKVAALLPKDHPLAAYAKQGLVDRSTDLAVYTRALAHAQAGRFFAERLDKAIDAVNGCGYWLDFVKTENLLDKSLVSALIDESDKMGRLFILAVKNVLDKIDS